MGDGVERIVPWCFRGQLAVDFGTRCVVSCGEKRVNCMHVVQIGDVSLERGVVLEDGRREGGVSMRGW